MARAGVVLTHASMARAGVVLTHASERRQELLMSHIGMSYAWSCLDTTGVITPQNFIKILENLG